ncbi:MAG: acetyl-CoA carboxylase biotin carboxylase subunit [Magnetovibrionaceae bacterium]
MFSKILIANRGEIACRVIKTARRMGIQTVAVYSEADKNALHVEMADEAVLIGPAPSAQSYLVAERIVQACIDTGAEAVHPGYGFLSENRGFQEALAEAGIKFIGPDGPAIEAMGDKIESKKLASEAGVSTVPGYMGVIKDAEEAVKIARDIGYPVMVKASAGGGGKGMRIARNDEEAREGFQSATNEAKASFADDRVFVEKFIEEPRLIEIQVLADRHGTTLYLGERECSIQRRHQKVIEEAPSPFLDEATRKRMGEQAVALARAVDYVSAGTVEFIVDADRNFYFLEMNTRLQVEHPVTEMITGIDLVEQMIRVAYGEKLAYTQDDIKLTGWAIEGRVYAEDPFRGFLPSTGRLIRYMPPEEDEVVRVDTGVYEGGEVSMFYDPMIAKLIAYGPDRDGAIANLREALDGYYIEGVAQNIPFLAALLANPRFVDGRLTTNFIAEEYPDGFSADHLAPEDPKLFAAVATVIHRKAMERAAKISGQLPGHEKQVGGDFVVGIDGQRHTVEIDTSQSGWTVRVDGSSFEIASDWRFGQPLFNATVNGEAIAMQVSREVAGSRLSHRGTSVVAHVMTPRTAGFWDLMPVKQAPDMSKYLLSPMPGLLVSVEVEEGQEVKAGAQLATVEAMKMENILRAERDGTVKAISAKPGDNLAVDQIIIEFA